MLALASCAGGDDGGAASEGGGGMPCTTMGAKSVMLANTAMDPCPQDMCPTDPSVPAGQVAYVTLATCTADGSGAMTWTSCQCFPKCGNGARQQGEECDGADLNGMSCQTLGKTGMMTCNAQCQILDMCIAAPPTTTAGHGG